METIFSGAPIETTIFYYDSSEIAYVVLEDEGDYWAIHAHLGDSFKEDGSVLEIIDKTICHPCPQEYTQEQYKSVVYLVEKLIMFNSSPKKLKIEKRKWR